MTNLRLRQFHMPDDLARLAELKNIYWQYYQLDQTTTSEKQAFLVSLDNHSPQDDNRVIVHPENSEQLIAHVWVWLQTSQRVVFDITVHPNWQRQGLGTRLLEWAIERANQLGANVIDHQISIDSAPERKFLRKNRFNPVGTFFNMRLANPHIDAPSLTHGYHVKTYAEINDLSLYTQLLNACYSDLWGHQTSATESDQAKWLDYYDLTGIMILITPEDEAIGIVRAQSSEQVSSQDGTRNNNTVDAPGLVPAYRQPALYESLVRHGVAWLNTQMPTPQPITMLSWGDLNSTIDCYWRVGFEVVEHAIGYRYYLKLSTR